MSRSPRPGSRLLAIVFLLGVLSISASTLMNLEPGHSVAEKRPLAAFPPLPSDRSELINFPHRFEQFFNDRFGFRQQLVYLNSLIRVDLLGVSPIDKVVVGKDDWLFYADQHAMDIEPLTPALLEKWRIALEAKQEWLAAQGIEYVFMIVPEKHTIYPEHLPRSHSPRATPTNLDLLVAHLEHRSTIRVLDVRPYLFKAKAGTQVYYKTDAHWNRFGASVATEALLRRIAERIPTVTPIPAVPAKKYATKGKDLAVMLLLQDHLMDDEVEAEIPSGSMQVAEEVKATPNNELVTTSVVHRNENLPRAVIFHDSFFDNMKSSFVGQFSRTVMVGGNKTHKFELDVIAKERPHVVVEEIVERYFRGWPHVPWQILDWAIKKRSDSQS
jgi:alginate O-acetyltransferase complex protein AlgJ